MKHISLILCAVCLMLSSCAHYNSWRWDRETDRAFKQTHEADLVVDYYGPERIDIGLNLNVTDNTRTPRYFNRETLASHLAGSNAHRSMVVICMGKVTQMQSDVQFEQAVNSLEDYFRTLGYKRIIFQLASSCGRPIYRETKNH